MEFWREAQAIWEEKNGRKIGRERKYLGQFLRGFWKVRRIRNLRGKKLRDKIVHLKMEKLET